LSFGLVSIIVHGRCAFIPVDQGCATWFFSGGSLSNIEKTTIN